MSVPLLRSQECTLTPLSVDSNINIQMNHWFAEMTNMNVVLPLFNYIEVSPHEPGLCPTGQAAT